MSCRYLVLPTLLALALGAQAREPSEQRAGERPGSSSRSEPRNEVRNQDRQLPGASAPPTQDADALLLDPRERQRRRDVLREALRAQNDTAPSSVRQLSAPERAALRQQLRQQQEWMK